MIFYKLIVDKSFKEKQNQSCSHIYHHIQSFTKKKNHLPKKKNHIHFVSLNNNQGLKLICGLYLIEDDIKDILNH